MKALVMGGTGPTGPYIVDGLLHRGYDVTIVHGGFHEVTFAQPVEHIHTDVHFGETLKAGLGNRTFDLVIAAYGRLRLTAHVMVGRTPRLISVGAALPARSDDPRWGSVGPPMAATEEAPQGMDPERDKFATLIAQAEQDVLDHHRAGHYNATHLRYPMLYGPRQPGCVDWCIVRRILDGRKRLIIADGGLKLRSRAHPANAAQGVLLAVDHPDVAGGKVYNVSDKRVLSVKQQILLISQAFEHEWEFVSMPHELARPFHPFSRAADHQVLDITKIRTELGYRDEIPAEEAVPMGARWLAENRPAAGSEFERQLADPFDYASEDAMIEAFEGGARSVFEIPFQKFAPLHPYRHPKRPNEPWGMTKNPWGNKEEKGE